MDGLETVTKRLVAAGIIGELWVDGSFVTQKIDPDDADVALVVDGRLYDSGTSEQHEAIDWIISNLKSAHSCDSYPLFLYPDDHPLHGEGEWNRAWYMRHFGFSRDDSDMKGIAVISLPEGAT